MRIAYLECFAGISGDMMLGALIDAGVPVDLLQQAASALNIGASLHVHHVDRSGIHSTKVDVLEHGAPAEHTHQEAPAAAGTEHSHAAAHTHDRNDGHSHAHSHSHVDSHTHDHTHDDDSHSHTHSHSHVDSHTHAAAGAHSHAPGEPHTHGRTWAQIRTLIAAASIAEDARTLALRAFEHLAHAEAKIHNLPVDAVHFHEVGSVDAIVDIVCGAVGLCSLRVDQWFCSALNVGGGTVECAHGRFPVPAPATAELLKGLPTYASGIQMELVTPTGAALLRALAPSFASAPAMRSQSIGYGAGSRDPKRFANVLRLSLGDSDADALPGAETVTVLECAIDDLSPQIVARTCELAFEQGALDVMLQPVLMKKGRSGTLLTVLCHPQDAGALQQLLFRETSTLGIRFREEKRVCLERHSQSVQTPYGSIRIKLGTAHHQVLNAMPEYEDCRRAAETHHVPLKQVMQAALAAFAASGTQP